MTPAERKRSSHVVKGRGYGPDLILQGIITVSFFVDNASYSNSLQTSLADEDVIQSLLPTTLVDLQQKVVKQTHPFHEYTVLRREYINMEIEKLVLSKR